MGLVLVPRNTLPMTPTALRTVRLLDALTSGALTLFQILLPLTTIVIRRLRGLRQGVMRFSDARVKYILEVIQVLHQPLPALPAC